MNGRETKFHHENIHYKSNIVCAAFVSVDHSARCYALLVDLSPYYFVCKPGGAVVWWALHRVPSVRIQQSQIRILLVTHRRNVFSFFTCYNSLTEPSLP